jgi:hypothetical protein
MSRDATTVVLNKIQTIGLIAGQIFVSESYFHASNIGELATQCAEVAEQIYDAVVARIKERECPKPEK